MPDVVALTPGHELARSGSVAQAEERLRRALEVVATLDAEVETLSGELADFGRVYEAALGDLHRELEAAEGVMRRLQSLDDALARLAAQIERGEVERPARRKRVRRRKSSARVAGEAPEEREARAIPAPEARESPAATLKRLYRKLARLLHPDLARDETEAGRLGALMARVNAAYAHGDMATLEVMAERHGAGEPPPDLDPEERARDLERRAATLERIAASLSRERDLLRRSETFRLQEEARRCEERGVDFLARSREEITEELAAARADVLARLPQLDRTARNLSRARARWMSQTERDSRSMVPRGPGGLRRAFDPLQESAVVRAGASRLDRSRATAAARELARWLEDAAPWQVGLTLLAFFAEDAGGRPPASLEGGEALADTWAGLRDLWDGAPDLARALEHLPGHLVLGARLQGDVIAAGVQLASADLAAGVRLALGREGVADVARQVLAALGPVESCAACGEVLPAMHRLRTRGLDEHHGLACASCGAIARSYWKYGELDGVEALAPHALALGLVAEVTVDLAGTTIGFQMSPQEHAALTADRLRRLFADLYLEPYEVDLAAADVRVTSRGAPLPPRTRLADARDLAFEITREGLPVPELLELLRARIEHRFRP